MYALVENNEIKRVNITLPVSIGNTSIGKGAGNLEQYGLYPIVGSEPAYDLATQRLTGPSYLFTGTEVQRVYVVESIPVEEITGKLRAEVVAATQQRLDDFARTRNYDGILSVCTYATSTVPRFATEGQYAVNVRDATWAKLYEMLADMEAGTRPMPAGFADIEPELPVLEWPQ